MRITASGVGAGTRNPADRANVVRVVVGESADVHLLTEANIDDMDPRLWPRVLELIMAAGADDAWLTPILMKKGRPAHTLSILCRAEKLDTVQEVVFEHTTTIGMRSVEVAKIALDRIIESIEVDGLPVRVKLAGRAGRILNVSIEFDDIAAAAQQLQRAEREVLEQAEALARTAGYRVGGSLATD